VPDARYFLDSRFELFPAAVWDDFATIAAGGAASEGVLTRWGVDLLVLPAGTSLGLTGWKTVYQDAEGAILGRDTGAMGAAGAAHRYLRVPAGACGRC
jgi:hypothetical protein